MDIIKQVAKEGSYLLQDPAPLIAVKEITGNYSRLFVGVWTTQKNWGTTRVTFLPELKKALEQNDIQLAKLPLVCK